MQPRLNRQGHQVAPANAQVRLQCERMLSSHPFFGSEHLNIFLLFVASRRVGRIGRLAAHANHITSCADGLLLGAGRPGRDPIGPHAFG